MFHHHHLCQEQEGEKARREKGGGREGGVWGPETYLESILDLLVKECLQNYMNGELVVTTCSRLKSRGQWDGRESRYAALISVWIQSRSTNARRDDNTRAQKHNNLGPAVGSTQLIKSLVRLQTFLSEQILTRAFLQRCAQRGWEGHVLHRLKKKTLWSFECLTTSHHPDREETMCCLKLLCCPAPSPLFPEIASLY